MHGATYIDEHVLVHHVATDKDHYYLLRELDSVAGLADEDGNLAEAYRYDAYGGADMFDGAGTPITFSAHDNPYFFTGRRLDRFESTLADPRLHLYHYRARAYDPVHGRFLQRDPAGYVDGMNLYEYAGANPLLYSDPAGLWKAGDHRSLTADSFRLANVESVERCPTLLKRLQDANVGQDSGTALGEKFRHYSRAADRFNMNVAEAKAAYTNYIRHELENFNRLLDTALHVQDCRKAADVLGRLTHTWQDYFAHAVLRNGDAGPAWTASPPIKGTPDNQNWNLKPVGWGSMFFDFDEHGVTEPAFRDGDGSARKPDAISFVSGKLKNYLAKWGRECSCYCSGYDF